MPRPPPEMPPPEEATVAGLLAGGGGSAFDSTRATGAGCAAGTKPVASLLVLKGLSVKRVVSELHPATPTAITASKTACGRDRRYPTTEDMLCPLVRNKQCAELTPWG
jgi:hypothetical protein